jgi:hypothetical protein
VIDFHRGCSRHRPALIDFVDHGEVRDETHAALGHLDRCDRCREAIEATVLTITALRRYGSSLEDEGPSVDAWPRLASRIAAWRPRPAVKSPLVGLAMSLGMVVALVLPFRLGSNELAAAGGSIGPSGPAAATGATEPDAIRAADQAASGTQSRSNPIEVDDETRTVATPHVVNGDIRVTVKEVPQSELASRLARPI